MIFLYVIKITIIVLGNSFAVQFQLHSTEWQLIDSWMFYGDFANANEIFKRLKN